MQGFDRRRKGPTKRTWKKNYSKLGQTVGLMLQIYETFYGTGNALVMDSGFYVPRGIVEL